jgi:protein-tyrosine phosphatase
LDLENHRSTPLSPELVVWADRVLAMGVGHLHRIQEMGGTEKGVLLVAFARGVDEEGDDLEVPDPYGGDDQVYEATYEDLRIQVGKAFARIRREAAK